MALSYKGSLPLFLLCPSVYLSIGGVSVSLNADLTGNLSLNASLSVQPPTLGLELGASLEFSAQLLFAAEFPIPVPAFSFSISDTVSLNASLELSLSLLIVLEA